MGMGKDSVQTACRMQEAGGIGRSGRKKSMGRSPTNLQISCIEASLYSNPSLDQRSLRAHPVHHLAQTRCVWVGQLQFKPRELSLNMADSTSSDALETAISKVHILGRDSIHLGFHLLPYIVSTVLQQLPSSNYILITDSTLAKLYLPAFQSAFEAALVPPSSPSTSAASAFPTARFLNYEIPPGERSKSRQTKEDIEDWLLQQRCTRDSIVLALGGGVVGDLTGFVCATFMRGIRYCQIPTTLLAMVDSAVGGKVSPTSNHPHLSLTLTTVAEKFGTQTRPLSILPSART